MGFIHDTSDPKFSGFSLETRRESFVIYASDTAGEERMFPQSVEFSFADIPALQAMLALASESAATREVEHDRLAIGTNVERIEIVRGQPRQGHGQKGNIVEVSPTRVRIMWLNKDGSNDRRTWLARDAEGQRWKAVRS